MMKKVKTTLILGTACLAFGLFEPLQAHAIATAHPSVAHPTPHVSTGGTHVSTPHASTTTTHTTASPSNHATTTNHTATENHTASTAHTSNSTVKTNTATKSFKAPNTAEARRSMEQAKHSATYSSLNTAKQRKEYTNWHGYYGSNSSVDYFTSCRYFWMPWNIWHNTFSGNNQQQDQMATNMTQAAKKKGYKWIKIGNKEVAVPVRIYNKIHKGDNVKLIDNNHIQVNSKTYKI